ncbi:hypothetical protein BJV85_001137 [Clostridium acetobutylicum]|uniref:jacalin-like lectin n=1 Tax=Clostridium TaxID=1485 RepID=UPI000200C6A8|nr:Conserved hypothetical protein [Clostridium acetobutylicum EA 2018]AEI32533.1 Conserved hypothetical protein [Clostridium acetobutylicum DSM 1731]AWV78887.1 hypothetical protein DK921_01920 [Clostridium acetobutylicum]PSM06847.1 hypothetical protein C7T89_01920 [Clostridium sp. NJ4]MBC2395124.1 hypothetical protein [Clostridium acetobutylicum]
MEEDFAYHNDLIKYVTSPYLTETSGNVPFGDGLNFISKYPFYDTDRVTWNKRYGTITDGSDQLTPKGFMYSQYEFEPGVYVDIYTLHADAGDDEGSYEARRDNIEQLAAYINENSKGNAVIVMGDTNTRYTRQQDNIKQALVDACNLKDAWVKLDRNGVYPSTGEPLMDETNRNSANFEVVDKILFRGSKSLTLDALSYRLEDTKFVDKSGKQLSDHYPIIAQFNYTKTNDIALSESFGGKGGIGFNYIDNIPNSRISKLTMRSQNRLDALSVEYADGTELSSGGTGGDENSITLKEGEYITKASICKGQKSGTNTDRIFHAKFETNKGQVLEGGTKTNDSEVFTVPEGWYIAGFFGRSQDEVDKLGVIYKKIP